MSVGGGNGGGGGGSALAELVGRVVVTLAVCILLSWQLIETVSFEQARSTVKCCKVGGTSLQWYLLVLMLLSVLEGIMRAFFDLVVLANEGGSLSALQDRVSLEVALGNTDQTIIALMIIGLGISGWLKGAAHSRAATLLGVAALAFRWLPAPFVLVCGVFCLQRTARSAHSLDDERRPSRYWCCTLRCALRPLLALALLETFYAALRPDEKEISQALKQAKQDAGEMLAQLDDGDEQVLAAQLQLLDAINPAQAIGYGASHPHMHMPMHACMHVHACERL